MQDLEALLESSGAILKGHFLLTSGRHSDVYFEKFRLLEQPHVLSALCARIASDCDSLGVQLVCGPTTGGIIVAFEVARQMGCRALYVESEGGSKAIRRGATIAAGTRVLVVDDVLTTGTSIHEVLELLHRRGAEPVAVGVLIDRSEADPGFGRPLYRAMRVQAHTFAPDEVPDWLAAIPMQKPGTRAQPISS